MTMTFKLDSLIKENANFFYNQC